MRKGLFKMPMLMLQAELVIYILVWTFILIHTLCMQAA